ncbi:uncharacterized protein LOC122859524 [Aphidius gifuensis]|uniref:uncharacterized protein LOC122859524 n=1 Tax=Aphidius gifuensis TaxID=684658 RepID=UPI001CDD06B6|nr:uncharacterized protein LOC122859524 [Aphidius gifuensis]
MSDSLIIKVKREETDIDIDIETLEELPGRISSSAAEKKITPHKTGSFSSRIKSPLFRYSPPLNIPNKHKKKRATTKKKTKKNLTLSPQKVPIPEITKIFLKPMPSLIEIASLTSDDEDPLSTCDNINSTQKQYKYRFIDQHNRGKCLKERQRRNELMMAFQKLRCLLPAIKSNKNATKVLILTEATNYCRLLMKTEKKKISMLRQLNDYHINLSVTLIELKRDLNIK